MAKFSINIKNKYGTETFQSVKDTYDWIVVALSKLNMPEKSFNSEFNFSIGEMNCTAKGIDEFIQHAYGVSDFALYSLQISVFFDDDENTHIFITNTVMPKEELHISANDKVLLQNIVDSFKQTSINKNESTQVTNQITINGGNNAIANNNSSATVVSESNNVKVNSSNIGNITETAKGSKIKEAIKAIITNIASNIIWYILCILAGILIAYFTVKQ